MQIYKSINTTLSSNLFKYNKKNFKTFSAIWPFELSTSVNVLEQKFWSICSQYFEEYKFFDESMVKSTTEYLVFGDAFSPLKSVDNFFVKVELADYKKQLIVSTDRYWNEIGGISKVESIPICNEHKMSYDFSIGGELHQYNKLGRGLSSSQDKLILLPNIESSAHQITRQDIHVNSPQYIPQGLGPISPEWPQRYNLLGTFDDDYMQNHAMGLAVDINWDYFYTSPKDQRHDRYLKGYEPFSITNMHETMAEIKGNLPSVIGRCFIEQEIDLNVLEQAELDQYKETEKLDDKLKMFKEVQLNLDSVYFFPNENIGVVVHRGSVEVSHPQAKDIKKVLIAHQGLKETPKTKAYYQEQMRLRSDPDEGFKHMMYTVPLLPEGVICGFKQMLGDAAYDEAMADNMTTFADGKKVAAENEVNKGINEQLAQLKKQGLDKEAKELEAKLKQKPGDVELPEDAKKLQALIDEVLPGITSMKESPKITNIDLIQLNLKAMDDVQNHMEAMAEKEKNKALTSVEEQIATLKKQAAQITAQNSPEQAKQLEQSIAQLEAMLANVNEVPILTRPDFIKSNKQTGEQINQAKAQLIEQKKIMAEHNIELTPEQLQQLTEAEKQLSPALLEQVKEAQTFVTDSYLQGAHFIPAVRSPHAGKEAELVAALIVAYIAGKAITQKDLAFCSLSQQQFSAVDLENGLFEYSQLSQIQFYQSNLTAINFAHAKLTKVTFEQGKIRGANLGSAQLEQCKFIGLSLDEITLAKSTLYHCEFIDCDFGDRMDMLLETQFSDCKFTRCKLVKLNFIELELTGCQFNQCDLSESNFISPVFNAASFTGSDLSKVNFVMAKMNNNNFEQAIMNNTRFIGGCDLKNSRFNHAEITETNLRDCQLQGADFSHAIMHKCDFGDSVVTNSNFNKAIAKQCQFLDTGLAGSTFKAADLIEANFMQADIRNCNFSDANLYSASFLNATLGGTSFYGAMLDNTLLKDWRPS